MMTTIMTFLSDPLDPKCSDWEVFDGTDCACADDTSVTCSDKGGMVCDNMGLQYKSACAYALATCNEKTPLERNIETCGKNMYMVCNAPRTIPTSHFMKSTLVLFHDFHYLIFEII